MTEVDDSKTDPQPRKGSIISLDPKIQLSGAGTPLDFTYKEDTRDGVTKWLVSENGGMPKPVREETVYQLQTMATDESGVVVGNMTVTDGTITDESPLHYSMIYWEWENPTSQEPQRTVQSIGELTSVDNSRQISIYGSDGDKFSLRLLLESTRFVTINSWKNISLFAKEGSSGSARVKPMILSGDSSTFGVLSFNDADLFFSRSSSGVVYTPNTGNPPGSRLGFGFNVGFPTQAEFRANTLPTQTWIYGNSDHTLTATSRMVMVWRNQLGGLVTAGRAASNLDQTVQQWTLADVDS